MSNYIRIHAMDTEVEMEGSDPIDINKIRAWFEQFEKICSRFLPDSELSYLNKQPINTVIQIESTLYEVLKLALDYAYKTEFLFNPFLGSVLKDYGYNKTFRDIQGKNIVNFDSEPMKFAWDVHEPIVFLSRMNGVIKKVKHEIDLGGIAKGFSVDKLATILKKSGQNNGIVNAGGDLYVWGKERTIGIQHPNPKYFDKDIIQFNMRNGAVATSNRLYRSWYLNGEPVNHILNGKNGLSTDTDVVQATVFSSSTAEADVLAKILCMHSFDTSVQWLSEHFPLAGCIVIHQNGKVAINNKVKNYITRIVM
ncbi:FAD:protein FMN transferase [Calidifontibacillus erzurumensis]|uniref:FAD:protein FMN transferase n=1 Tax=Calidifontibacillus erzurumensis TaxID=2741433 RepID=A0A8J8KBA6_9BACI|nr:FAD:protein FMN transferase [Calidifontibacillus erzurumensis]NSL50858.1 FAD:protein FMN transferase [Calidifontibacillus erzurumensis]